MRTLLILRLDGMRYGIWDEDVRFIEEAKTIHRLPLSPDCIAGMSIIDDRSVTLAELAVCIGNPAATHPVAGHTLLVSGEDRGIGFVVRGEIDRVPVPTGALFPMPEYLKTSEIAMCAVLDSEPIPIINLSQLSHRIHTAQYGPLVADGVVASDPRLDLSSCGKVKVFKSGGELFCLPSDALEEVLERPAKISRLAHLPRPIVGITFHGGSILPVIHLARQMKLPEEGSGSRMLVAVLSGARFGCLVDTDEGTLPEDAFSIRPLPPLVACDWMRAAVVHAGEILPLIGLASLLSSRPGARGGRPLRVGQAPGSPFSSAFGREEVEVVEFSLRGARHALPKCEVGGTFGFTPFRTIPNLKPIVVGVAEYGGELLPVIDLALCFGRRSVPTPAWQMILVRDGDFRALAIAEAVCGDRRLPVEMQRALPIGLPYGIVYGCYPDASTVRLILNVEALAVHYDRRLARDAITTVLQEMRQAPTAITPSLFEFVESLGSGGSIESEEAEESLEVREGADGLGSPGSGESPPPSVSVERAGRGGMGETGAEGVGRVAEVGPAPEAERPSEAQPTHRERLVPAAGPAQPEAPQPENLQPSLPLETRSVDSGGLVEQGECAGIDEPRALVGTTEPVRSEAGRVLPPGEPGPTGPRAREEEPKLVREIEPVADTSGEAHAEVIDAEESTWAKDAEEIVAADAVVTAIPETVAPDETGDRTAASAAFGSVPVEAGPASKWRNRLRIAGVVVAMIAAVYGLSVYMKVGVEDARKTKAETAKGEKAAPGSKPSVALHASGDAVLDGGIYKVKRGDTLWAVSKRLTGNPLNYRRLATENAIPNPDLIFPGQQILVHRAE
jgi:chemotaxis signal transduction protein